MLLFAPLDALMRTVLVLSVFRHTRKPYGSSFGVRCLMIINLRFLCGGLRCRRFGRDVSQERALVQLGVVQRSERALDLESFLFHLTTSLQQSLVRASFLLELFLFALTSDLLVLSQALLFGPQSFRLRLQIACVLRLTQLLKFVSGRLNLLPLLFKLPFELLLPYLPLLLFEQPSFFLHAQEFSFDLLTALFSLLKQLLLAL